MPPLPFTQSNIKHYAQNLVWDVNTLTWVVMHQPIIEAGSVTIGGTLPLPTGASTAAKQDIEIGLLGGQSLAYVPGNTPVGSTDIGIVNMGWDGTLSRLIKTDSAGELQVDILSLPNEGQQTMANSISVAIASNQSDVPVSKVQLLTASGQTSSSGNTTVITPTGGKKIRVAYLSYNPASATEAAFRFGAAGSLFMRNAVPAGGIVAKDFGDFRYIEGATDEILVLNLTAAVTTTWNVFYTETT